MINNRTNNLPVKIDLENDYGKLPPQTVETEEILLGAMIIDAKCAKKIFTILPVDAFYKEAHKIIYKNLNQLSLNNSPIDIITVSNILKQNGELDNIGGDYYLTGLINRISTSANSEFYAFIILQQYIKRELITYSYELTKKSYDNTTDIFDLLEYLNKVNITLSKLIIKQSQTEYSEILENTVNKIHELSENKTDLIGISTGFKEQDKLTSGRCKGELIVIAARPAMGKTAFILTETLNLLKGGIRVGLFSLEMTGSEILNRIIANILDIPLWKIRRPSYLNILDLQKIDEAKEKMMKFPLKINDRSSLTIDEISLNIGIWVAEFKIEIVYLDYIQLLRGNTERGASRQQEIGSITRGLKAAAKEYDIPVIALAQVARSSERTTDKKPSLADLRESGDIENDADIVEFIFRPEYYKIETDAAGNPTAGIAEIYFGKNRHGSLGKFMLNFEGDFCRFKEGSQIFYETETNYKPF